MSDAQVEQSVPDRDFFRLIGHALLIGLAAGAAALGFVVLVELGTGLWYPDEVDYSFGGGEVWWIAVTATLGLVVGLLRAWHRVPAQPGGVFDAIHSARIDHTTAPQLVLVSLVSLIGGAPLGPFDAGARSGGAIGEWFSKWRKLPEGMRAVNSLSGTNGGVGALLTAPFVATLLIVELVRPTGQRYYGLLVPNLVAATAGFAVFYLTVGETFVEVFAAPGYEVRIWHFGVAIVLGVVGAALAIALGLATRALTGLLRRINAVGRGVLGGLAIGGVGVLFPLAMFSGKEQLGDGVEQAAALGAGLLLATVVAKILLMATSVAAGFIGGPVMPTLAIGGLAGLAVHEMIPDLPTALTLSCLLVAMPGAVLAAPFTAVALAVLTVGLGPVEGAPAGFAAITAYLVASAVRAAMARRTGASAPSG